MSAQSPPTSSQNHRLILTYVIRIRITIFFSLPLYSQPAIIRPISPPTESVHDHAPPEEVQPSSPEQDQHGFFAWLHSITPARSTFLQRARLHFFRRPQRHHDEGLELQERPPSIINVPLAQGLLVSTPFSVSDARLEIYQIEACQRGRSA